jgi:hypothetical protein
VAEDVADGVGPQASPPLPALGPVERAVVEHALARGWLRRDQLEGALRQRAQLEGSGRPAPLLALLEARLRPEHVEAWRAVHRQAARAHGAQAYGEARRLDPHFAPHVDHALTQAQWLRATGDDPSDFRPGARDEQRVEPITGVHPVERVSWDECADVLRRLGLRLPSEAEWEYACRAGTTSTWWTGDEDRSLAGAANLVDLYCKQHGGPSSWRYEEWLDDGRLVHGPVGSYRANAFGLHDVAGNVWEWVEDTFQPSYEGAPTDGSAWVVPGTPERVTRGGGWRSPATSAASAYRGGMAPSSRINDVGVRPAMTIAR